MDLAQLLGGGGNDPTGLLTPQQSGDINQSTLQGIAAGLMKASGPSPYKPGMTALSGIGEAFQGGLAARRQAQQDALTQTMVRSKTLEGVAPLLKLQQQYAAIGVPMPANYQRVLDAVLGLTTGNRPSAPGTAGAPGGTPMAAGGGMGTPMAAGGGGTAAPGAAGGGVPTSGVSPQQNLILQTADRLGISRYDLMEGSGARETALSRINDEIKANQQSLKTAEEDKAITAGDVASYGKEYSGIQGASRLGTRTVSLADQIDAVRNLMKTSGYQPGGIIPPELSEMLYKITGNRNAVTAMQLFPKLTAESLSGYMDMSQAEKAEMGSSSAGKQLLSTVNLFLKASPNLSMTDDAMGYLSDQLRRHGQEAVKVGDMAADFKTKNKRLNSEWDKQLSQHMKDNPTYGGTTLEAMGMGQGIPGALPGAPAPPPPLPPPQGASKEVLVGGKVVGHVVNGQYVPMQAAGPAPVPR